MEQTQPYSVTLDLSPCEYLDSTFLGCLLTLHKRSVEVADTRFLVVADEGTRQRLLNPTRLDAVLQFAADHPNVILELKTKSANVSHLLRSDVPPNIIVSLLTGTLMRPSSRCSSGSESIGRR